MRFIKARICAANGGKSLVRARDILNGRRGVAVLGGRSKTATSAGRRTVARRGWPGRLAHKAAIKEVPCHAQEQERQNAHAIAAHAEHGAKEHRAQGAARQTAEQTAAKTAALLLCATVLLHLIGRLLWALLLCRRAAEGAAARTRTGIGIAGQHAPVNCGKDKQHHKKRTQSFNQCVHVHHQPLIDLWGIPVTAPCYEVCWLAKLHVSVSGICVDAEGACTLTQKQSPQLFVRGLRLYQRVAPVCLLAAPAGLFQCSQESRLLRPAWITLQ